MSRPKATRQALYSWPTMAQPNSSITPNVIGGQHLQHTSLFTNMGPTTITGGTFTQVIERRTESRFDDDESQFELVKWGHISLLKHIGSIVTYKQVHTQARRVKNIQAGQMNIHHARVFPSSELFTLVSFDGDQFESAKNKMIEMQHLHSVHIPKLFGVTHSKFQSGILFHDDLLPVSLLQAVKGLRRRFLQFSLMSQFLVCKPMDTWI
ncbi:hypothetical protein HMN09_01089800 [Mycena chlorophos]|uniref:Uncharacterized protein n=1 Tax=Mycena chlorophos TaxID=658473 RepID=A0A8H6SAY0_MYCCL|nr:hypothetical protein HMN09_01089800 [Mycena chlorophos]